MSEVRVGGHAAFEVGGWRKGLRPMEVGGLRLEGYRDQRTEVEGRGNPEVASQRSETSG